MKSKIQIRVLEDKLGVYTFDGKLSTIKENINRLIEQFGENAELEYALHGYTNYCNDPEYGLFVTREETGKEYEDRLQRTRSHEQKLLDERRKTYEKLKKEFGE